MQWAVQSREIVNGAIKAFVSFVLIFTDYQSFFMTTDEENHQKVINKYVPDYVPYKYKKLARKVLHYRH